MALPGLKTPKTSRNRQNNVFIKICYRFCIITPLNRHPYWIQSGSPLNPIFYDTLGSRWKHQVRAKCLSMKRKLVQENLLERWSMYGRLALCESAWCTIWGRLVQTECSNTNWFSDSLLEVDVGCFLRCSFRDGVSCGLERRRRLLKGCELSWFQNQKISCIYIY